MPSINDAKAADLSGYQPVDRPPVLAQMINTNRPKSNPFRRCPLPPFNSDPDTLRQFEEGTNVPQIRVIPLPPFSGVATALSSAAVSSSSSSGGGGSSTTGLVAKTAVITTGVLNIGGRFTGHVLMAKSFQLLGVTSNRSCEVRVYGSSAQQGFDSARLTDAPVPAEISSNIITDVVFDTLPYRWAFQNRIGANQDTAQTTKIYVTIVNTGSAPVSGVQVTISYIPLES